VEIAARRGVAHIGAAATPPGTAPRFPPPPAEGR
jgi:hypothetical protein